MAHFEIQDGDDWVVIKQDGEVIYRGHQPCVRDFEDILVSLGHTALWREGEFDEDGDDTLFTPY
jgi:hypothetical protein